MSLNVLKACVFVLSVIRPLSLIWPLFKFCTGFNVSADIGNHGNTKIAIRGSSQTQVDLRFNKRDALDLKVILLLEDRGRPRSAVAWLRSSILDL